MVPDFKRCNTIHISKLYEVENKNQKTTFFLIYVIVLLIKLNWYISIIKL